MTQTQRLLIAPSLLAADFTKLAREVEEVEKAGADWLHLDIMDGHFVPNISYGPSVVKALRKHSSLKFDVHLMVEPVDCWLEPFADAGADHVTFHIEAGPHAHRTIQTIRHMGLRAGIALCPATPAEAVSELMDMIDLILVMSVNPGFGGQKFIQSQVPKIRRLREMAEESGRHIHIGVDGGIDPETAPQVIRAGADMLVAGSAIYGKPDYGAAIAALKAGVSA
ncbi:ribulose-phosphate 3-epimerase [Acetobacter sp. AN02]|uniref:ribulose-phosphate 3-epimerase n=1 Tax=Acetobacter sp. AN02 TaxID=2894186 RepID=UPI00243447D3|nr:ribulose-phosphate 3-epimerase [Acetobacter sp. AN02]MDG6095335.1 ribulose-phosphate 3-epimerase [Acetobacter sp. AN02]